MVVVVDEKPLLHVLLRAVLAQNAAETLLRVRRGGKRHLDSRTHRLHLHSLLLRERFDGEEEVAEGGEEHRQRAETEGEQEGVLG